MKIGNTGCKCCSQCNFGQASLFHFASSNTFLFTICQSIFFLHLKRQGKHYFQLKPCDQASVTAVAKYSLSLLNLNWALVTFQPINVLDFPKKFWKDECCLGIFFPHYRGESTSGHVLSALPLPVRNSTSQPWSTCDSAPRQTGLKSTQM